MTRKEPGVRKGKNISEHSVGHVTPIMLRFQPGPTIVPCILKRVSTIYLQALDFLSIKNSLLISITGYCCAKQIRKSWQLRSQNDAVTTLLVLAYQQAFLGGALEPIILLEATTPTPFKVATSLDCTYIRALLSPTMFSTRALLSPITLPTRALFLLVLQLPTYSITIFTGYSCAEQLFNHLQ